MLSSVLAIVALASCERRDLTYNYYDQVSVDIAVDWSNMDVAPSGMSIYFYPDNEEAPTIVQTNNISGVTANLSAGNYNILVFNQIPSDFGTIDFEGMGEYSTAQVSIVATKSGWATVKSNTRGVLAREPEALAVATYEDFVVTEEAIRDIIELNSKGHTRIDPYAILNFKPKVITKDTRVRVKVAGIDNHRSTRATLYGMSTGYNFSTQKSFSSMTTHVMEEWEMTKYNDGSNMGELRSHFASFGLPEQTTTTRSGQWDDWEGRLDIDILLVDNKSIVSQSEPLNDKVVSDSGIDADLNVDIAIDWGFDSDEDSALSLPDVEPEGSDSGFKPTVDDWSNEVKVELEI